MLSQLCWAVVAGQAFVTPVAHKSTCYLLFGVFNAVGPAEARFHAYEDVVHLAFRLLTGQVDSNLPGPLNGMNPVPFNLGLE